MLAKPAMKLKVTVGAVLAYCLLTGFRLPSTTFSETLYLQGEAAYKANKARIKNPVMCLVDFSLPSHKKRLFLFDMKSGKLLLNTWVSHGRGSGRGALARTFSNEPESYCSSLGSFLAKERFNGKHGKSLRLEGLNEGLNDNAEARGIIFHTADYVNALNAKVNKRQGNSQGCFVVDAANLERVIGLLENGGYVYASR